MRRWTLHHCLPSYHCYRIKPRETVHKCAHVNKSKLPLNTSITTAHTWIILYTKNQHNHYYLVELERDHDTEAESEPDGTVEKEEQLAPSLARIGSQPQTRARRRRRRRICYSRTCWHKCDLLIEIVGRINPNLEESAEELTPHFSSSQL